ncbi:MAG: zf-TFIIB domain-containing protein [Acidobacteriota bacterium]|nr:zf-TFIIB domain-containing protein [Acidobacteriota bacterium]
MDCPACRKPLVVVERDRIELDWCVECSGLWFDDGELELLAENTGRRLDPEDVGRDSRLSHGEKTRACPRCDQVMEKALVGRQQPVLVDRCEDHGFWLDRGELGRIVRQLSPSSGSDEAVIIRFLGETFSVADQPL